MIECCNGVFPARNRRKRKAVSNKRIRTPSGRILVSNDYCFDPYQLLQVRRDATDREIVAGYRKFALLYHPVRSTGNAELFAAVAAAYETLIDPETRHALKKILADYYNETSTNSRATTTTIIANDDRIEERDEPGSGDKRRTNSALVRKNTQNDNPIEAATGPATMDPNPQHHHVNIQSLFSFPAAAKPRSPSLIIVQSVSTSSTTMADTHHYSHNATERLFGGPLKLMHQARRFEAFTDPYDIFERVFGSSMGRHRCHGTASDEQEGAPIVRRETRLPYHMEHQQQQHQRLLLDHDGMACRQQGNRLLTRTIRQCGDQRYITVTSEPLLPHGDNGEEETTERRDDNDDDDPWFSLFCCS